MLRCLLILFILRQSCALGHLVLGTVASECHLVPSAMGHRGCAFPRRVSCCRAHISINAFCPALVTFAFPCLSLIVLQQGWVQAFFHLHWALLGGAALRTEQCERGQEPAKPGDAFGDNEAEASSSRAVASCMWIVRMSGIRGLSMFPV